MPPELEYTILLLLRQQLLDAVHQELHHVLPEVNECASQEWLKRTDKRWQRVLLYFQKDNPTLSLVWGHYDPLIHQATSTHYRLVTTNMRYCYPNSYYTRQNIKLRYTDKASSVVRIPTSTNSTFIPI